MNKEFLKPYLPEKIFNQLDIIISDYEINTVDRMANFLGQCAHESLNFTKLHENLNYGKEGLRSVFRKYFSTDGLADMYARQPEKIANRVYANRMGNGDEQSGDGWKHRGFGSIQVTGKNNQQAFFRYIDIDENTDPSIIETEYPLISAAWFWKVNGLNELADKEVSAIKEITKKINNGYIGLEERNQSTNKFYKILA